MNEENEKLKKQILEMENMAKQYLSQEALVRFGSLKSAHPEKALQVSAVICQLVNEGHIKNVINDQQFKDLLVRIEPENRQSSFRYVRK
ncbi:MAG: DNA-binding protein [Nanoarchaeota archaeon]